MVVGKKQNHNHNLALAALLETARRCNVSLNNDKLQYKKTDVDFFWRNIHNQWTQTSTNQSICNNINARAKLQEAGTVFYRNG